MSAVRRLLAALLLLPLTLSAQAPRARKIFISVDMEGITGVVQPAQLGPEGFEYQRAREWMTGEVNAAIAGIRAAGPAEIVVCDSHGNGERAHRQAARRCADCARISAADGDDA